MSGHRGLYSVFPVEYKKGKPKITDEDKLQLTAQAMCLEEMFSTTISEGALYYGETRRRENITFSQELRDEVKEIFQEMHQYYERGYTPKVKKSKACNSCSLKAIFPILFSHRIQPDFLPPMQDNYSQRLHIRLVIHAL